MDKANDLRDGEVAFRHELAGDDGADVAFIGRVRSPWTVRRDCPKNVREARQRGGTAFVEISPRYRPALDGLVAGQWITLVTWLHEARRDLALQRPRHSERTHGTFSLRSPVRPNPIGLHLVRLASIDADAGRLDIDAVDVLDWTPVLDLKPFLPSVDVPPPDFGD
jgi:tRNA (adenine37-N6)-methyltransferase